jgi:peptide-methionine (S)-S-oxide reductase
MVELATFAAGCFWGVEEAFLRTGRIAKSLVGYTGGGVYNRHYSGPPPTYKQVCSGQTGLAEAVRLEFDPSRISYRELCECFWKCHDPTQLNRQGPDIGTQYRSAIFFHSPEQEAIASESRKLAQAAHQQPIVTIIEPVGPFFPAEEYHQQYLRKCNSSKCSK